MMTTDQLMESALPSGERVALMDPKVLSDLTSLTYTRAVVFTDRYGKVLQSVPRSGLPSEMGRMVDIAMGALSQTGVALRLGKTAVSASLYEHGVVLFARGRAAHLMVLADEDANLGRLLNLVRRGFTDEEQG